MMLKFVDFFKTWCQDVKQNFKVNPKAGFAFWRLIPIELLKYLLFILTEELMSYPGELLNNLEMVMDSNIIITLVIIDVACISIGIVILDLIWQLVLDLAGYDSKKGFIICRWVIKTLWYKVYFNPFSIWIRVKLNRE